MLSWEGRFDDPRKALDPSSRFRTLYVAQTRVTAFRETLQDLHPEAHTRAEYKSLFGTEPPPGIVAAQWRADRRLARGRLVVAVSDLVALKISMSVANLKSPMPRCSRAMGCGI